MDRIDNLKVDTSKPVLVTGATGYIAGVLIKQLLELGVTVHGAVRDPSKTARLQHLIDLADVNPGKIIFFKGDLLQDASYEEGMKSCGIVFHVASPYIFGALKDPQKDLVDPAVNGTRNVLKSASNTPSVTRVVLTSSAFAVYTDACDSQQAPNNVLTEDVFNFNASLEYMPYAFSKTMAEIAAWQIAGSQRQWTLVVMNPGGVFGPGVKYHGTSESYGIIKQMGDGTMKSGSLNYSMGVVDVRDVARAHIVGGYNEKTAGRHLLVGHNTGLFEMASVIRQKYPDYPLPTLRLHWSLVWLLAPFVGMTRKGVWRNVDVPINLDNSKSKKELGIEYHSLESTMQDMFQQLVEEGVVTKT